MTPLTDLECALIRAGLIDALQLQVARGRQRQWGRSLEQAIVDLHFVSEEILFAKLAEFAHVDYMRIGDRQIPREVLRRIPERVVRLRRVLPIEIANAPRGTLVVAMETPSDLAVIDEMTFMAGMRVKAVLASPNDLDRAIARHYPTAR